MRILRTMYYVPVVSSLVAVSVLWNQIYTQNGLLNAVLDSLFGIEGPAWLYDPGTVKWAIIIFTVWKGVGGTTVLYLAGLQNINRLTTKRLRSTARMVGSGLPVLPSRC